MLSKLIILWVTVLISCSADRIIIDTDAGVDDATGILLLLRAEQNTPNFPHKVIAITCSYGNTEEENVEKNVLKILTIANRSDIPVYGGIKKPIIEKYTPDYFFGKDGLGDFEFPLPIIGKINESAQASTVFIELTKKYEDVSIITLGPTTNVALATLIDPKFTSRVKQFWIMGGSVAGVGNFRPNAEFNFATDPEATFILLNATKSSQLTLFPWDTGFKAKISMQWRKQILGAYKSPYIDFLNAAEAVGLASAQDEIYYISADSMTTAVMLMPNIVSSVLSTNVEPVIDGSARGSVRVDYLKRTDREPNARIILSILPELYKKLVVLYLTCEYIACYCSADRIIIDTDAGGDDATGILLLLRAEQNISNFPHKVIAITCSYGNTEEENVEKNVLKILTIANRSDIPVYGGIKKPIIEKFTSVYHYGKDGLGNFEFPLPIIGKINESAQASTVFIELTKKYEDVSIIVLGPTTNVALATLIDPMFTSRVKQFWIMGGSVAGVGNIRPNVEFNFAADPEANFILLNATKSSQLTLFPWDTGFKANISPEWRKQILGAYKSPYIDFLNAAESISLTLNEQVNYLSADSITIALMLMPNIVGSVLNTNVEPVIDGSARGSVRVDYLNRTGREPNARIILSILPELYKKLLVFYLTCEYIAC